MKGASTCAGGLRECARAGPKTHWAGSTAADLEDLFAPAEAPAADADEGFQRRIARLEALQGEAVHDM